MLIAGGQAVPTKEHLDHLQQRIRQVGRCRCRTAGIVLVVKLESYGSPRELLNGTPYVTVWSLSDENKYEKVWLLYLDKDCDYRNPYLYRYHNIGVC